MACFVSLSFSVPLISLQNPLKVRYPKKSAFCRLPCLGTTKTASYSLAPCSSNKGIFSVNGEHHLTTLSKHSDEIVSCSLNALAFCPGKWTHQAQLQTPDCSGRSLTRDAGCSGYNKAQYRNSMVGEASGSEIYHYIIASRKCHKMLH